MNVLYERLLSLAHDCDVEDVDAREDLVENIIQLSSGDQVGAVVPGLAESSLPAARALIG